MHFKFHTGTFFFKSEIAFKWKIKGLLKEIKAHDKLKVHFKSEIERKNKI